MTASILTDADASGAGAARWRQVLGAIVAMLAALAVGATIVHAHPGALTLPW